MDLYVRQRLQFSAAIFRGTVDNVVFVYNPHGGFFIPDKKACPANWLTISNHIASSIKLELEEPEDRLFWQESMYVVQEITFIYHLSDSSQRVVVPGSAVIRHPGLLHAGAIPPRYADAYFETSAYIHACLAHADASDSPASSGRD